MNVGPTKREISRLNHDYRFFLMCFSILIYIIMKHHHKSPFRRFVQSRCQANPSFQSDSVWKWLRDSYSMPHNFSTKNLHSSRFGHVILPCREAQVFRPCAGKHSGCNQWSVILTSICRPFISRRDTCSYKPHTNHSAAHLRHHSSFWGKTKATTLPQKEAASYYMQYCTYNFL